MAKGTGKEELLLTNPKGIQKGSPPWTVDHVVSYHQESLLQ